MIDKIIQWLVYDSPLQGSFDVVFKEAERQGSIDAFKKAHADIMETMIDDVEKKGEERAKEMLREMLSPVDYRQVISVDKRTRTLFRGTEAMNPGMIGNLKAEAQFFKESELWKLLSETPKMIAHEAMFVQGDLKSFEKGRAMLYHLDSQQKILDTISTFALPPQKE